MPTQTRRRSPRRTEALSRERIVETAVELLDAHGEAGLTFRTLTERLATGPGAVYHHVANKGELLGAATDAVVAAALAVGSGSGSGSGSAGLTGSAGSDPADGLRAVALGLFDAIDEHPWLVTQLATQLSRDPGGSVAPRIFEGLGRWVRALGVPESRWFTATSALVHYVLGAAGQNAVNGVTGRALGLGVDRAAFLDTVSTAWKELDPDAYPFTRAVADQMREHDDHEEFLAGLDLVLAGITAGAPR